jgi:hypothetical protein
MAQQNNDSKMNPDDYFATINGEDYATRHARLAREEFERVKAAATTPTELARVAAYERHVEDVKAKNAQFGANWNPHAYHNFKWEECVLCHREIRDDPYGHNPAPLKNYGHCCSECNTRVVEKRMERFYGAERKKAKKAVKA